MPLTSRLDHSGGAVKTTLTVPMTVDGPVQIDLADTTNWPLGDPNPFYVVVDRGEVTEEKMLVALRVGTTLTVVERGSDNTTPQPHSVGAEVEHVFTAKEAADTNDHTSSSDGVHGLGSTDRVLGLSDLVAHADLDADVHGASPDDPLATQSDLFALFVPGEVKMFLTLIDSEYWLPLDGGTYSADTYPDLAALYGAEAGETFTVADMTGAFPRGDFGMAEPQAAQGSNSVALATANLPGHTHSTPGHSHSINHNHGAVDSSNAESELKVRKGDNIEPEADKVGDPGDKWTNNNSDRLAAAGGAGGTLVESKSYSTTHSHSVNLPSYSGTSGTGGASTTGSTGSGQAVDKTPRNVPVAFYVFAGQYVP